MQQNDLAPALASPTLEIPHRDRLATLRQPYGSCRGCRTSCGGGSQASAYSCRQPSACSCRIGFGGSGCTGRRGGGCTSCGSYFRGGLRSCSGAAAAAWRQRRGCVGSRGGGSRGAIPAPALSAPHLSLRSAPLRPRRAAACSGLQLPGWRRRRRPRVSRWGVKAGGWRGPPPDSHQRGGCPLALFGVWPPPRRGGCPLPLRGGFAGARRCHCRLREPPLRRSSRLARIRLRGRSRFEPLLLAR